MRTQVHFLPPNDRPWTGLVVALLFLLFAPAQAGAQRKANIQRFKAGLIAGVTASQIDGDNSAGYHKVGLQGGLRGIIRLHPKQELSVEMLFTQRGCRNQPKYIPEFSTTLNYAEVPFEWHYKDWPIGENAKTPDYYRMQLNVGFSYARLINYSNKHNFDDAGITAALPDLNTNSFCFLLGASLFVSKHVAFTVRYNRSLNNLYKPGKPGTNYAMTLSEHFLAFQSMYVF